MATEGARAPRRLLDVTLALAGLLLAAPLLLRAMALIWREGGGPFFDFAERVGRGGNPFPMLKLSTMVVAAERCRVISTADDDSRVTGIGRVRRRCKIDDLPALWNVLHGEMSRFGDKDPWRLRSVPEGHKLDHEHAASGNLG